MCALTELGITVRKEGMSDLMSQGEPDARRRSVWVELDAQSTYPDRNGLGFRQFSARDHFEVEMAS